MDVAIAGNIDEQKGYVQAIADGSRFYIPDALHIERDDNCSPWIYEDDEQASRGAEEDGIKLIYDMDGVPDGVYIDTPENREVIREMLVRYPKYKDVAERYNKDRK